ncbi:MAG: acetyl-CoA carboxylase biotin carboxyl carrier protein subunit, partial [Rhodospirillaceae bacterium]|nr:acetyl-CoA carboxylase biotin carboxyl carrier protein subunit [Rhodospirillaceae bacterium]
MTSVGASVKEGDELMILEAMKMETPITAPCAGTVKSVDVAQGQTVAENQVLCTLG